jgi:hypothetical protein
MGNRLRHATACQGMRLTSWRAQPHAFATFRREYHHERRHEALADATPVSCSLPSRHAYPNQPPPLEYPAHLHVERAYPNGVISFRETPLR